MVRAYLSFWKEHRSILLEGDLAPLYPHLLYPIVTARQNDTQISALYGNLPLECGGDLPGTLILVNGTYRAELILDLAEDTGPWRMTAVDCMGTAQPETARTLPAGLHKVPVPPAGHTILRRG